MNHLLIHIHGFLSANDADRVVALREYIEASGLDVDVISPRLPNTPELAVNVIEKIIDEEKASRRSIALIGHSLGGYFATYIASKHQLRAVLVNPVVRGYEIMCEFFGECYNPHTDERFEIGEADIEYLVNIHREALPNPGLFLVMQQLGDEITDPDQALDYYRPCKWIMENGGCHDFSHFENHVEPVMDFLFGKGALGLRIGILSDTHDLLRPETLTFLAGCSHIIHAGDICDSETLATLSTIAPVTAVRGNNDKGAWVDALAETETIELGENRLYVIHDLKQLNIDLHAMNIQIVVTGHSHNPKIEERSGVVYINPGSAGPRRFSFPVSVGEIVVKDAAIQIRIVDLLQGGVVAHYSKL